MKKINLSDTSVDLWSYYKPEMPFCVGRIGSSDCRACQDTQYYVQRDHCQFLAIEYVREGSGTLWIDGKTYRIQKGSVFFLPKNSSHRYYPDKTDLWIKDWLVLDGELAHKLIDWYLPQGTYCIPDYPADYLFSGIRDLHETYRDNYEEFTKYATLLFCSFMMDLRVHLNRNGDDVAYRVKYMIDYSSQENLSVSAIAEQLHYSVNYIIRTFRQTFGCTPAKYYMKRKMDLAQLYLRTGDASISEISDKLHFVDQHYFSNVFKSYAGVTPSQYRAKFRSPQTQSDN